VNQLLYGGFVWVHRALSSQKRRFPARAVADDEALVYQVVRVCELIEVDLADPRRPRNPRHAGFNQAGIWPGNTASNCRGQRHRTANSPTYNPVSTGLLLAEGVCEYMPFGDAAAGDVPGDISAGLAASSRQVIIRHTMDAKDTAEPWRVGEHVGAVIEATYEGNVCLVAVSSLALQHQKALEKTAECRVLARALQVHAAREAAQRAPWGCRFFRLPKQWYVHTAPSFRSLVCARLEAGTVVEACATAGPGPSLPLQGHSSAHRYSPPSDAQDSHSFAVDEFGMVWLRIIRPPQDGFTCRTSAAVSASVWISQGDTVEVDSGDAGYAPLQPIFPETRLFRPVVQPQTAQKGYNGENLARVCRDATGRYIGTYTIHTGVFEALESCADDEVLRDPNDDTVKKRGGHFQWLGPKFDSARSISYNDPVPPQNQFCFAPSIQIHSSNLIRETAPQWRDLCNPISADGSHAEVWVSLVHCHGEQPSRQRADLEEGTHLLVEVHEADFKLPTSGFERFHFPSTATLSAHMAESRAEHLILASTFDGSIAQSPFDLQEVENAAVVRTISSLQPELEVVTAEPEAEQAVHTGPPPHFLASIKTAADWSMMSRRALKVNSQSSQTEGMKVIVRCSPSGDVQEIWFLHTPRYSYHFDFAKKFIDEYSRVPFQEFLHRFSDGIDRSLVLVTLVYYRAQDVWAFEMDSAEPMENQVSLLYKVFREVQRRTFFGAELRFHGVSPMQAAVLGSQEQHEVPVVTSEELHRGTTYQAYTLGHICGILRCSFSPREDKSFDSADIVYCPTVPADLRVTAALITAQLQTPLCHVGLLCQNRETPNCAIMQPELQRVLFIARGESVIK
jgi:hypothetical protein